MRRAYTGSVGCGRVYRSEITQISTDFDVRDGRGVKRLFVIGHFPKWKMRKDKRKMTNNLLQHQQQLPGRLSALEIPMRLSSFG